MTGSYTLFPVTVGGEVITGGGRIKFICMFHLPKHLTEDSD